MANFFRFQMKKASLPENMKVFFVSAPSLRKLILNQRRESYQEIELLHFLLLEALKSRQAGDLATWRRFKSKAVRSTPYSFFRYRSSPSREERQCPKPAQHQRYEPHRQQLRSNQSWRPRKRAIPNPSKEPESFFYPDENHESEWSILIQPA